MSTPAPADRSVALVSLGCARNEVDSEELAGRLAAAGWTLVPDPQDADVAVVNTCGFIEAAKKDSIDVILQAHDLKESGRTRAVVAVGCLAERYGRELARELPEADAVLGFDSYADLSGHLTRLLEGDRPDSHVPADRRRLLPLTPSQRPAAAQRVAVPGHGGAPARPTLDGPEARASQGGPILRRRLDDRPWAPLKIASGCDRRCAFCAIPSFRGPFVSRPPQEILAEARWLAGQGVRELLLVSENSTSYGKDLGDVQALEVLLPELAEVDGVEVVRVSYLQPAEMRPGLIEAIAGTPGVAPYFDLSFQHASAPLLRRMRRFGSTEDFCALLDRIRSVNPEAGVRSNVIVGFPGEDDRDVAELERFLVAARLDVCGVFGYSDEDGTEAAGLDGHLPEEEIAARYARVTDLVEELTAQRAGERVGERLRILVEEPGDEPGSWHGRAAHQGPDVDGVCRLLAGAGGRPPYRPGGSLDRPGDASACRSGDFLDCRAVAAEGVDLIVTPLEEAGP